jgi:3-oxoacyl-[acyl-carrier-protein] synthase III
MRIENIEISVPSLAVNNAEILRRIEELNERRPREEVRQYRDRIGRMLHLAGSEVRYFRDIEAGETAYEHILSAATRTLANSEARSRGPDLLIYCGVGRGFLEPGMSHLISRALGLRCECFDILDACMSWIRAVQIAHTFLNSGAYSTVLVINGEFSVFEHGFPAIFEIGAPQKWRYSYPAFTVGEAATATLLTHSSDLWKFSFTTDSSLAHLCTIPLSGFEQFSDKRDQLALNGVGQFMSFGTDLSSAGLEALIRLVSTTYPDNSEIDWFFPHSVSKGLCDVAATRLRLGERLYSKVFRSYGNVVSASVPLGIYCAQTEGLLNRGQRIVLCPASAGMTAALVELTY